MRIPIFATLLACGLWWTSAAAIQAQQETQPQPRPDQPVQTADDLDRQAREAAQRAQDLADQSKQEAQRAKDLAAQARDARRKARQETRRGERPAAPDATERRELRRRPAAPADRTDAADLGQPVTGMAFRADTLRNMNVLNRRGEDLGSVNDLVVNADTGEIRYVVVAAGGFLGIGEDLFAIPWNAFEIRERRATGIMRDQEFVLVVDIARDRLGQAPRFQRDAWPDFRDDEWGRQVDRFYDTGTPRTAEQPGDVRR